MEDSTSGNAPTVFCRQCLGINNASRHQYGMRIRAAVLRGTLRECALASGDASKTSLTRIPYGTPDTKSSDPYPMISVNLPEFTPIFPP